MYIVHNTVYPDLSYHSHGVSEENRENIIEDQRCPVRDSGRATLLQPAR
jgi:hypothetical protein